MRAKPKTPSKKARRPSPIGSTVRKGFVLATVGIVLIFGSFGLFGKNGMLDMFRLRSMHHQLTQDNTKLEHKQAQLKTEILRLKDPRYTEYLARESLGLMRPNEVFIILDEAQTSND